MKIYANGNLWNILHMANNFSLTCILKLQVNTHFISFKQIIEFRHQFEYINFVFLYLLVIQIQNFNFS